MYSREEFVKATVDDLMGSHRSRPYNPLIANTFFQAGFIEAWGRGIEKIKDSCTEAGNPMPEYVVKKEDMMVTFKSLITDATPNITQGTTQTDISAIGNSIPMRILKVIKDNLTLSQMPYERSFLYDTSTIRLPRQEVWIG